MSADIVELIYVAFLPKNTPIKVIYIELPEFKNLQAYEFLRIPDLIGEPRKHWIARSSPMRISARSRSDRTMTICVSYAILLMNFLVISRLIGDHVLNVKAFCYNGQYRII